MNQPLYTAWMVPQLSPVITPKWQTGRPGDGTMLGSGDQLPSARQDVVHRNIGRQADRLPVGDLVIGVDGGAVGSVVTEQRLVTDEMTVLIAHHPVSAAVAGGERNPRLRVDVAQRADSGALDDLHARVDQYARVRLCGRRLQRQCDDRGRRRHE